MAKCRRINDNVVVQILLDNESKGESDDLVSDGSELGPCGDEEDDKDEVVVGDIGQDDRISVGLGFKCRLGIKKPR